MGFWTPFGKDYDHVGLNEKISRNKQKKQTNEAARQHDIGYHKAGSKAYWKFNQHDVDFIDSVATDLPGKVGKTFFSAKKYLAPHEYLEDQNELTDDVLMPQKNPRKRVHDRKAAAEHKRFKESSDTGSVMDHDQPPQSTAVGNGKAAAGSASFTQSDGSQAGTGGFGLEGGGITGNEVIPGHQEDDLKPIITMRSSNTFKVYYEQTAGGKIQDTWLDGIANSEVLQSGTIDNNLGLRVTTPWKFIPNNRLTLYCTPNQLKRYHMAGYTHYRVKRCGFKLYGIYNMQNYDFTGNLLQGMDTAYGIILEPEGNIIKNQTPVNHIWNNRVNPNAKQLNFIWGDVGDFMDTTGAFTPENTLQNMVYNMPGSDDTTVPEQYYLDLPRHSEQTLIRNGGTYEWSWDNPSDQWINIYGFAYPQSFDDSTGNTTAMRVNYDEWPMEADGPTYKRGVGEKYKMNQVSDDQKVGGLGLVLQGVHDSTIRPVLFKIPKLDQESSNLPKVNHTVFFYVDYQIEIEWKKGAYTKLYNSFYTTNPDGFNMLTGNNITTIHEMTSNEDGTYYPREMDYGTTQFTSGNGIGKIGPQFYAINKGQKNAADWNGIK